MYTYIICEQNDVDYETVFALIERGEQVRVNAAGDGGASVGLMQIAEKWQQERMEELNCTDLTQPFQNVRVGVDILSELQEKLKEQFRRSSYHMTFWPRITTDSGEHRKSMGLWGA